MLAHNARGAYVWRGFQHRPARGAQGKHPYAPAGHKNMPVNLESIRPMRAQSIPIPAGDAGTCATIDYIRKLVDEGKKSPLVREAALLMVREFHIRQHDLAGEARAIYSWVLQNIRFTRDIRGKETLHSADEILRLKAGDCDDYTILICSLLGSIGHKLRIVTVSNLWPDPETGEPGEFTHIYPEDFLAGRWVPLDAARRSPAFARAPRRFTRRRKWALETNDYEDDVGYLNFYVEPFPTLGLPQHVPYTPGPRGGKMGAWSAPGRMVIQPRRRGGLGQFDWSTLAQVIAPVSQAAEGIIAASKGAAVSQQGPSSQFSNGNLTETGGSFQTGVAPTPYSYPTGIFGGTPGMPGTAGVTATSYGIPTWMLLAGGALAVFAFMKGRG